MYNTQRYLDLQLGSPLKHLCVILPQDWCCKFSLARLQNTC